MAPIGSSVSGGAIKRSAVHRRAERREILRIESPERGFNCGTESGYAIAHALA